MKGKKEMKNEMKKEMKKLKKNFAQIAITSWTPSARQ
jgi:hypothetical protein